MQPWLFGLGLDAILLMIALIFILNLLIQGLFLGVGLGVVNGKNRDIGDTFVTALLMSLVIWIPCLGCILAWYFIKSRHGVGWGGALIAWIVGGIIQIVVMILILMLFFGTIIAAIFGALIPFMP
ncbi:MAG: hypothetical protein JW779_01795 [Candidatus Thorarchaeota archaeon]|nr:hypothetical protein [Candidatus Thorarchaeota archaeon]